MRRIFEHEQTRTGAFRHLAREVDRHVRVLAAPDEQAGPVYLLSRYILGISPASPGFDRIRIEPRIAQLEECYGTVPTPHGWVRLGWKRCVDHIEIRCGFPASRIAELYLPMAGARYELYDSQGCFQKEDAFLSELELTGGTEWVLRVYDGKHVPKPRIMNGTMNAHVSV